MIIYGLGILSQQASKVNYRSLNQPDYSCELSVLLCCFRDAIAAYNNTSEPESSVLAFINNIQGFFLGIRFLLSSKTLWYKAITTNLDFSFMNDVMVKLIGCLKNIHASSNQAHKSFCILSIIHSLGVMVENKIVENQAANEYLVQLIELLSDSSRCSMGVSIIELKGVVAILPAFFNIPPHEQNLVKEKVILRILRIPFETNAVQNTMYKQGILTEFCSAITLGLSLMAPTDDALSINVLCNLFSQIGEPDGRVNARLPGPLIDSLYQRIYSLIKKQSDGHNHLPSLQSTIRGASAASEMESRVLRAEDDYQPQFFQSCERDELGRGVFSPYGDFVFEERPQTISGSVDPMERQETRSSDYFSVGSSVEEEYSPYPW